MRGWARQRDANEKEIVAALRAVGASVTQLDGKGVPDLLVGWNATTILIEVKRPVSSSGKTTGGASRPSMGGDGTLTKSQREWFAAWKGAAVHVVETPEQALLAIGYPGTPT